MQWVLMPCQCARTRHLAHGGALAGDEGVAVFHWQSLGWSQRRENFAARRKRTVKSLYFAVNGRDNARLSPLHRIHMPNLTLVRRRNALVLFQQFAEAQLAEGAPPKGLEQSFAAQVEISPSMWSQLKSARPIGDKLARQLEHHCGKPAGWLDEEREAAAVPDVAEERFVALARQVWRSTNAHGRRELTRWLRERVPLPVP
jgi:hypothetical protein